MNAQLIPGLCLVIFVVYWVVNAASTKPIQETRGWLSGNWYSILLLVGVLLIVDFNALGRFGVPVALLATPLLTPGIPLEILSSALSVGGLVVAIGARHALGRNWSGAVALKVDHELVTTGLYQYVRHPIYAGILLMVAGAALASGTLGAGLGYLVIVAAMLLKLRDEEHLLSSHFPQQYPDYKKRTKVIIPFLW